MARLEDRSASDIAEWQAALRTAMSVLREHPEGGGGHSEGPFVTRLGHRPEFERTHFSAPSAICRGSRFYLKADIAFTIRPLRRFRKSSAAASAYFGGFADMGRKAGFGSNRAVRGFPVVEGERQRYYLG